MSKSSGFESPPPDHAVWLALSTYSIGPASAGLSFARRLARENGWSEGYTDRVIEEYKRFAFLAMTSGRTVTPSDPVDQAWHLHLTYSRDYWERFCPEVLGGPLHHGPTLGGSEERQRHFDQYAETLKLYEEAFGTPPADIWPEATKLLDEAPRMRRVNPHDYLVLDRKWLWLLAAVLVVAHVFPW